MQINKPELVCTFTNITGGATSLFYNLINYSTSIKHFYSKVILMRGTDEKRPPFLDKFNADETITYSSNYKFNKYHALKSFSKLLGSREGVIFTDNLATCKAAIIGKVPKTIYFFNHDFYYIKESFKAKNWIDMMLTHSPFFADVIQSADPILYKDRVKYLPYGVKQNTELQKSKNQYLKLVFVGRLDEGKGLNELILIENILQQKNIQVEWTIIGKGPLKQSLQQAWTSKTNVQFVSPDTNDEVLNILESQDILVFPTKFEGTPVAILESISRGVVPIVTNLPGGIRDVVQPEFGHLLPIDETEKFGDVIAYYHNNRSMLYQRQKNAHEFALQHYDIEKNANNYFEFFLNYKQHLRSNKSKQVDFWLLDRYYIPNFITTTIRSIIK